MIVEFSTEVSEYQIQDPEQDWYDNVPYSYRGETGTNLLNVTAALSKDQDWEESDFSGWGESLTKNMPVQLGDTVHVVVVTYQSGDTFGLDGGHTKVLDAFTALEDATALRDYVDTIGKSEGFNFAFRDKGYYAPWAGYFEHLESVSVWGVQIKPHHDYQFGR